MHTKIHRMIDNFITGDRMILREPLKPDRRIQLREGGDVAAAKFSEEITRIPLFLFEHQLNDMMTGAEMHASIKAMSEAGCLVLPFPDVIVETEDKYNGMTERRMTLLRQKGSMFTCLMWIYRLEDESTIIPPCGIDVTFSLKDAMIQFDVWDTPYLVRNVIKDTPEMREEIGQTYAKWVARHLAAALILLNTGGIKREVVQCEPRLNKARAKHGKAPIPEYTVIQIGKVYTSSGAEQTYDERKSPRVHIRRAHNRHVRTGKGRTGTKLVHIPAVLVNFDPATGEKPKQKRYVVRGVKHEEGNGTAGSDVPELASVG